MKISFVTENDCWLIFMFSFQLRRSLYREGTKLIVPLKNISSWLNVIQLALMLKYYNCAVP